MLLLLTPDMLEENNSRYFVCTTNGHNKYYVVDLVTWICKYWKIGSNPSVTSYDEKYVYKKITEKIWKWYTEIYTEKEKYLYWLDKL